LSFFEEQIILHKNEWYVWMMNILQSFHHTLLNPTKNLVDLYDFDFGKWLMIFENNVSAIMVQDIFDKKK
jgi:hypothetical protein